MSDITLAETSIRTPRGDTVLAVSGPICGRVSVRYDPYVLEAPTGGGWQLYINYAPTVRLEDGTINRKMIYLDGSDGSQRGKYSGAARIWAELDRYDSYHIQGNIYFVEYRRHGSVETAPMRSHASLERLAEAVLSYWHTPQRLHIAKLAHARTCIAAIRRQITSQTESLRVASEYLEQLEQIQH
ncbi:hypothetical protein [Nocardia terpenica]|nr:hypothetical protein [Nocardia terpenica]NQE89041.1 hypothetical protein [Nocardia terpenica]